MVFFVVVRSMFARLGTGESRDFADYGHGVLPGDAQAAPEERRADRRQRRKHHRPYKSNQFIIHSSTINHRSFAMYRDDHVSLRRA